MGPYYFKFQCSLSLRYCTFLYPLWVLLSLIALFHLSPRLCPSTAGCSPPSMPSIVLCLLLSCFTFHLGFVHPLQDVALHQCLPLSSVCCFPVPGCAGSTGMFIFYLVIPLISSLYLVATLCSIWSIPPIVHSCYTSGPSSLLFHCAFYNVNYLCSFPDLWAWYLIMVSFIGLMVQPIK